MYSVTSRIAMIKQPHGGYIKPKSFTLKTMSDDHTLYPSENLHGSIVGLTVDYLTRLMLGAPAKDAFDISLTGARIIGHLDFANYLIDNIVGIDDVSVIAACKLVTYDTVYRAGAMPHTGPNDIMPDPHTIANIQIMVRRCLSFFEVYGPMTKDGFTFEGGYTDIVSTGDGDFLTEHTMWDLKVLRGNINAKHTLQIVMYYLMGKASGKEEFQFIKNVGFYNPRQNNVYVLAIQDIDPETLDLIRYDIIGY